MFLQSLNTDMLSSQGTAVDSALDLSITYFNDQDQTNRVVLISIKTIQMRQKKLLLGQVNLE